MLGDGEVTFWTDESVEKLKALWADGVSATEIGGKLGFSRCAVLGKVWRLNLAERRRSPVVRERRQRRHVVQLPLEEKVTIGRQVASAPRRFSWEGDA